MCVRSYGVNIGNGIPLKEYIFEVRGIKWREGFDTFVFQKESFDFGKSKVF
jgi:hypothetical protein